MADIKIANATYYDVESLELSSASGEPVIFGIAQNIFRYGGTNAVKVSEFSKQWTLSDTSFVIGSSASTSATTIKATEANVYTTPDSPTVSFGDSDIIVIQKCLVTPAYSGSATNKARQLKYACVYSSFFSKRKTTDTSAKTTRQIVSANSYINKYYNSSSALTRGASNYGFYMSPQGPTMSSSTSASAYVKCSSPLLYYRVSSSYMSSANIKLVTECTFDWSVEVYKVDPFSTFASAANDDVDLLLLD